MSTVDIGDLPSWIIAVLIGIAVLWGITNGELNAVYSFEGTMLPLGNIATILVVGGVLLGGFHFLNDILNKL